VSPLWSWMDQSLCLQRSATLGWHCGRCHSPLVEAGVRCGCHHGARRCTWLPNFLVSRTTGAAFRWVIPTSFSQRGTGWVCRAVCLIVRRHVRVHAYHRCSQVSQMCDVYSFGVLLAFLFTGQHSPVVPPDMQVGVWCLRCTYGSCLRVMQACR
jgi:hypothetical protein